MTITPEQLLTAAKKSAAWLVSRQGPMGNYLGAEQPDGNGIYPDTHDIGCYYKSIHFLRAAGESFAAARAMDYVVKSFMTADGDFYNTPDNRTSGSYTPTYCQLYPNLWLIRAAAAMEQQDLVGKIMDFLLKYRDPSTGGFYASVNPATDIIDSNATGYGVFCCLLAGLIDEAVQSGELLLKMLNAQPRSDVFYLRWRSETGYITDFSDIPEKHHIYCRIAASDPAQAYWCWAWPMNGLIKLYGRTRQEKYLEGAVRIYDFLASCHENAFHFTTAGKGGWGSAMLYRITGEERYLKTAMSQMHFILSAQQKEGYMLGPGTKSFDDQPLRTTYDFTADFGSWLVGVAIELAGRE